MCDFGSGFFHSAPGFQVVQVVPNIRTSLLFTAADYSVVRMCRLLVIRPSTDGFWVGIFTFPLTLPPHPTFCFFTVAGEIEVEANGRGTHLDCILIQKSF